MGEGVLTVKDPAVVTFERQAIQLLQADWKRLEALHARSESGCDVAHGSSLLGDDTATAFNPISHQVALGLAVAADHLTALRLAIDNPSGGVTAMSMFTLVRSSIEASCNALWILSPTSRDERVLRSLRMTLEYRRNLYEIQADLGVEDTRFEKVRTRLEELRDARPGLAGRSLTKLSSQAQRLKDIDGFAVGEFLSPLIIWRLSSGIAHGNGSVILNLLERELIDGAPSTYRLTTNTGVLAMFHNAATNLILKVLDLRDRRNVPAKIL